MVSQRKLRLVYSASPYHDQSVPGGTLNTWSTWMQSGGLSQRTIRGRLEVVDLFARRMHVDALTVGWEPVAEFLAGYEAGTQQVYRAELRSWFRWLVLMDYRIDDPTLKLHKGRPVKRHPRPLSADEVAAMLLARQHHMTPPKILLGAYEGFRCMEIAKMHGDDVQGDQLHVIGKGGLEAWIPIHPLVAEVAESMPQHDWWFPSHIHDGPVDANSVSVSLGKLMRRIGIGRPKTPHSLRHFFGTELLRATGDLRRTQELMRHENIASTVMYTQTDQAERLAAVLTLPVPAQLHHAA